MVGWFVNKPMSRGICPNTLPDLWFFIKQHALYHIENAAWGSREHLSRFFQIALRGGGIHPVGGIKNFAGINFFIRWWEPEEEWFWPLRPFSKLKATSCKYRALIKTKIGMTCAGFYPSTFMCSRFSQKNQFLCCLLSPVAPWGSPMVDTKGKIFELYVCWSLENTFGWIFLGILEFYDEFGRKVARKIYATFLYACL